MFEDFDHKNAKKDQRRFWMSVAGASVLYISLAASLVAASAAARTIQKEEEPVEIEFTPPPEVEPPPPAPPPPVATPTPPSPRPKVQRQELEMPEEVPDEKPAESDKALSDAPASDAGKDGFTNGSAGGTGTAVAPPAPPPTPAEAPKPQGPVQLPENGTPAVAQANNAMPAYPEDARKAGISSVVIAKYVIKADGTVDSIVILRGDPIFHAAVKAALSSWRYEPAKLPDGTPISVFKIMQFPFRLENM